MPSIVDRDEQRYAGYRATVGFDGMADVAHQIAAIVGKLAERGLEPADAPFFRYLLLGTDMRTVTVEAGVPVADPVDLGDEYFTDVVPAGKYAQATHHGPPSGLFAATADLLAWGEKEDVRWDRIVEADGEHWGARLEIYRTDPQVEPDANNWDTDLCFRLAD
ncbi:effector-binding domain-containing protein [Amycolatopsis echigonensis]|uniref:Effector-binding domain-containing protein n=1 Tax=Amycolatopsis echigonensis TaxID=2576905 RepID=A0A2N3WTY8_9PSEU|nr:GyrI-like domain-containing protein [Amycolatopsis niigatensis]PKV97331.1 effector-binding domain-containing protein [Amycolatopsis niigatensis]